MSISRHYPLHFTFAALFIHMLLFTGVSCSPTVWYVKLGENIYRFIFIVVHLFVYLFVSPLAFAVTMDTLPGVHICAKKYLWRNTCVDKHTKR